MLLNVILWLLVTLLTLLVAAYLYSHHVFRYFQERGVPYEPASFPFGILWPVMSLQQSYSDLILDIYNKNKRAKFVGFFQFFQRSVLIVDRELIKNVLVKDFDSFDGKSLHHNAELEPLTTHLFALDGPAWRLLRMKMTSTFTSGKLKNMFGAVVDVAEDLSKYTMKLTGENDVVECRDLFMRYGLATIASTAFGLDSDVLTDKSSIFYRMAESIQPPTIEGMYRNALWFYGRDIAQMFGLRILPKDTHDFYMKLVKDTVKYRETTGTTRNDFLQLLMQLKQGTRIGDQEFTITIEELAAQAYVFIIAGFETSSNTMSFCLYELALNPEVQRRVLAEVDGVDNITYDTLASMDYLDMVIDETLRKYPTLGFLGRVCSRDYRVPDTDQVIEKGTNVLVSIHGLHHDPELFPDPEQFIPERFSKENKDNIKPYSYMPFGEGPRFCIGMRFGKMSIKAGLVVLLKQFEVRKTARTPTTLQFEVRTISTTSKGGMWLQFLRRRDP